jgi:hypothetical protein
MLCKKLLSIIYRQLFIDDNVNGNEIWQLAEESETKQCKMTVTFRCDTSWKNTNRNEKLVFYCELIKKNIC